MKNLIMQKAKQFHQIANYVVSVVALMAAVL